ncbi:hypothetical protein [Lysinibacillus sp. NPDC056185]|uniref:hypothetical protein n=1 Tax=Lysinibacillus sp. NPDC056185 TaxID=3345739 RepID=UPI0039EFBE1E
MRKFPYFKYLLPIASEKPLNELAKSISNKIPFGGLEDYLYEEVPAVYINSNILGFELILQGYGGE